MCASTPRRKCHPARVIVATRSAVNLEARVRLPERLREGKGRYKVRFVPAQCLHSTLSQIRLRKISIHWDSGSKNCSAALQLLVPVYRSRFPGFRIDRYSNSGPDVGDSL